MPVFLPSSPHERSHRETMAKVYFDLAEKYRESDPAMSRNFDNMARDCLANDAVALLRHHRLLEYLIRERYETSKR